MKTISILIGIALFALAPAFAKEIVFVWEPSPSAEVIGYGFYYGQEIPAAGQEWAHKKDAGNVLTTTLDGNVLAKGPWYFAVTAYTNTMESDFSNIVDYNREGFVIVESLHIEQPRPATVNITIEVR